MLKNIYNLGDAALYCDFGENVNKEINSNVIKYFKTLQNKNIKNITNLVPSYNKLIITFDLNETCYDEMRKTILNLELSNFENNLPKKIKIPICLDDEFALDMERLTYKLNINKSDILTKFLSKPYFCYMTGFIAGMPFLGDIDKNLRLNRIETPRVEVPKGSVGITEQFCNIYTFVSPGGWNIIGNTPAKIFDFKNKERPTLITPGDEVEFYEITKKEFDRFYD